MLQKEEFDVLIELFEGQAAKMERGVDTPPPGQFRGTFVHKYRHIITELRFLRGRLHGDGDAS